MSHCADAEERIRALLAEACAAFDALEPEEQARHRAYQRLSFVYGNLACTTNHRPTRRGFEAHGAEFWGLTELEFAAWLDEHFPPGGAPA